MNYPVVLVNFRVPVPLKEEFEDSCRRLHMPMTAQVNLLMREFEDPRVGSSNPSPGTINSIKSDACGSCCQHSLSLRNLDTVRHWI